MKTGQARRHFGLDSALLAFGERVDQVPQQLYYSDVNFSRKDTSFLRQGIRASAYVHLAAAVEAQVYATTGALAAEISAANLSLADMRLSLFAVSSARSFTALEQLRGLKNWERRCQFLDQINSSDPVQIDGAALSLGGRTIRPKHLDAVWRVFGLPGTSLPSPLHALALQDVADSRNDVAHGNEKLSVVAGRKSPTDMLRLVTRIEEVGLHLFAMSTEYLDQMMYRR